MDHNNPFDTVESAYDFLGLLSDSVADAKQTLRHNLQEALDRDSRRRIDTLRVALYNLNKLEGHVHKSARIVNDLRSLRRLLFKDPAVPKSAVVTKVVARPAPLVTGTAQPLSGNLRKSAAAAD